MNVVVTGVAGFIGSNLAHRLLQRGDFSLTDYTHQFRQTIYTILGSKININPSKISRLCLADTPFAVY